MPKPGKAVGLDEIPAEALKMDTQTSADLMTPLLENVWKDRRVPIDWKKDYLFKLPKKEDLSQCKNWLQDQWLTYKRPRWTTRGTDTGEICFNEVNLDNLPTLANGPSGYCISVFGSCPYKFFIESGAAPYMNTVICCLSREYMPDIEKQKSQTPSSSSAATVQSFVTLGYPSPEDKKALVNFTGTKVLNTYEQIKDYKYCPQFYDIQLKRRVVESMFVPESLSRGLWYRQRNILTLFNVTKQNAMLFESLTGIWLDNAIVHVIYCEYGTSKTPVDDHQGWPVANYAIPKSLNNCPKGSVKATMRHQQDRYGFHYSQ
ncbi:unnamed protein product, partial [Trichobilharzia regenti]